MIEFLFSTGVTKDWIITYSLNIAGNSEGKKSFAHRGTRDHPDESPQSIVKNSFTMHQLMYEIRS